MNKRINVYFVASGKYHDIDFARLEILKLLGEDERIRTIVAPTYDDLDAIHASDFLITYTCDVTPSEEVQKGLKAYVDNGGRWFALHGTNSILRFLDDGRVDSPREAPIMMETLGSQFLAHPPIDPYTVTVSDPDHPLVKGVEPFEATDELYLSEYHGHLHPLLETEFKGKAMGFVKEDWDDDEKRLVMYLHQVGKGEVLYFTLGHCRGHYDMQPNIDYYPEIERCSWDLPIFYDLLRRGIDWAKTPALAG
jgi:hypothetical protein